MMARKPRTTGKNAAANDDTHDEGGEIVQFKGEGRNSLDGDALQEHVEAWEEADREEQDIMAEARKACQPFRDRKKDLVASAATLGTPKKVFSAYMRQRKLFFKSQNVPSSLDDEQRRDFSSLVDALGDFGSLPLGQAALDAFGED